MLFRLAVRNVKGNFRNYMAYFLSVILNVSVFYLFSALRFNSTLQNILGGDVKVAAMFQVSGWLISLFAVIFLWYSTSFFLLKRKQEIGLYALLGVRRARIGWALFAEMMVADLLSLAAGLLVGIFLSRLLFLGVGRMLELTTPLYRGISLHALLITAFTFLLIFLTTACSSFRIVCRCQLSELFSARVKEETPPPFHRSAALLGVALLLAGYGCVYSVNSGKQFASGVLLGAAAAAVGTFLIFRETVPMIFTRIRHSRHFLSDLRPMMNISGVLYRIRESYRTWAVLSLLVAAAVSLIIGGCELAYTLYNTDRQMHPFTFTYIRQGDDAEQKIDALMSRQSEHEVLSKITTEELLLPGSFTGRQVEQKDKTVVLISESALRALEKACKMQTGCPSLKDNEAALLGYEFGARDLSAASSFLPESPGLKSIPIVFSSLYNPAVLEQDRVALVVSDQSYQSLKSSGTLRRIVSFRNASEADTSDLTLQLQDILPTEAQLNYAYENTAVLAYTKLLFFILTFIGLLFLAATGSILRFKAYWEGADELENDRILRRLGASREELLRASAAQARTMFLAPLLMAIMHILVFCAVLGHWKLISSYLPIAVSLCACVAVYLLYYLATALALRKNIINMEESYEKHM